MVPAPGKAVPVAPSDDVAAEVIDCCVALPELVAEVGDAEGSTALDP